MLLKKYTDVQNKGQNGPSQIQLINFWKDKKIVISKVILENLDIQMQK